MPRLSSAVKKARSNRPRKDANAARSSPAGRSRTTMTTWAPVRIRPRSRDIFHARPTLRTDSFGQYTAYSIECVGIVVIADVSFHFSYGLSRG